MIDLLEQAGEDLVGSVRGSGPTASQLRQRLHRRRRRRLTAGTGAVGAIAVVVVLVVAGRHGSSQVTTVPADPTGVDSSVVVTVAGPSISTIPAGCVAMPDLVGMSEVQAVATIGAAGATGSMFQQSQRQALDVAPGTVLEQTPAPATPVCSDTSVSFVIAEAPYVVQPGDTYASIAQDHQISVDQLLEANRRGLEDPITVGDRLIIASPDPSGVASTVFRTIPTPVPAASPLGDVDRIVATGGPVGLDPATGYQVSSVQVGVSASGGNDANVKAQAVYLETSSAPAGRWLTAQQVADTIDHVATQFPWTSNTDPAAPAGGYRGRVGERSTALIPLVDGVLIIDGELTTSEFERVLEALVESPAVELPYVPAGYAKTYGMSVVPPEAEIVWATYYTAPGLDPALYQSVVVISRFRSTQRVEDFNDFGVATTIGGHPAVELPIGAIMIDVSPTVQIEVQDLIDDVDDLPALLPNLRALTPSQWGAIRAEAADVMERRRLGESDTPSTPQQ